MVSSLLSAGEKPPSRCLETEPEGLVPPGAPEAGETAVEDLVEGAEGGREVPGVGAEAQDGRAPQEEAQR